MRPKTNERAALGPAGARRAGQVHRVDRRRQAAASGLPGTARRQEARPTSTRDAKRAATSDADRRSAVAARSGRTSRQGRETAARPRATEPSPEQPGARSPDPRTLIEQLTTLEEARQDGVLELRDGERLKVTNLHKLFWPKQKLTKGDLFRYYVRVAPFILPAIADRPLVMKRFPNGVAGKPFYQHRAAGRAGRRARRGRRRRRERGRRSSAASLKTLLYMTQLAAISQDPWFSRVQSSGVRRLRRARSRSVRRRDVRARARRRALDPRRARRARRRRACRRPPAPTGCTSTSRCRRARRTRRACCSARSSPRSSRRSTRGWRPSSGASRARGKRVYVDYLQNILGKTLATAYSARASVRRRLDAADVGRGGRRRRAPGLHDRNRAGPVPEGRRPVGRAAEGKRRGSVEGVQVSKKYR